MDILLFTILKMLLIICIGCLIARVIPLTQDIRKFIVMIILNVALPALILSSYFQTSFNQQLLYKMVLVFFLSIVANLLFVTSGWLSAKLLKSKASPGEVAFLSAFGNAGFIGIPLCATLFGPTGALLASVFDAGMNVVLWTVGIFMLQKNQQVSWSNLKSLLNLPLVAVIIGLSLTWMQIHPFSFITNLTVTIGGLATPLAMIYIGMLVMHIIRNNKDIRDRRISLPAMNKLFLLPLLFVLIMWGFTLEKGVAQVILIQVAMPTLATASLFFARYKADEELGVLTTLYTTLFSFVTIPIVYYIGLSLIP